MNPYTSLFPLTMPAAATDGVTGWHCTIDLPAGMCPVSGNPLAGSILTITPRLDGTYAEVYAVAGCAREVARELIGGFAGDATRPAVRDMEGACAHVARAVATLLGCPVDWRAELVIQTPGQQVRLTVEGRAAP